MGIKSREPHHISGGGRGWDRFYLSSTNPPSWNWDQRVPVPSHHLWEKFSHARKKSSVDRQLGETSFSQRNLHVFRHHLWEIPRDLLVHTSWNHQNCENFSQTVTTIPHCYSVLINLPFSVKIHHTHQHHVFVMIITNTQFVIPWNRPKKDGWWPFEKVFVIKPDQKPIKRFSFLNLLSIFWQ